MVRRVCSRPADHSVQIQSLECSTTLIAITHTHTQNRAPCLPGEHFIQKIGASRTINNTNNTNNEYNNNMRGEEGSYRIQGAQGQELGEELKNGRGEGQAGNGKRGGN